MINIKDLHKSYKMGSNSLHVLKGINFSVSEGELVAIMGSSGSGKSTLLNIIGMLDNYDKGSYELDNILIKDLNETKAANYRNKFLGFVFQSFNLINYKSAVDNVILPLYYQGIKRKEREKTALDYLDNVGLKNWASHLPSELSGGQKQRVAIGRALLSNPKILILDEPLTGLDDGLKAEVIPYLEFVRDNFKIPILYISHSQSEVVRLSDRIVVLEKGRILEQGKTLQILSSFSVAKKLGLRDLSSFVEAKVSKHASDGITELDFAGSKLFLPKIDAILGSKVYLRILAKDITLAIEKPKKISALNILQGKVDEVILGNGPGAIVGIEVGGHRLTTRITQRSLNAMNLKHGQTCFAFLKTVSVATSDVIT